MPIKTTNNNLNDANLPNDELAIINELLSATLNSADFNTSINLNVQILRGYLDCDLIEILIPKIDENIISLVSSDFDPKDEDIATFVQKTLKQKFSSEQYINTPVWKTKKIQWLQLKEQKNVLVRQEMALASNISTVIALPVFHNETIVSVIYIFYKKQIEYNIHTEELLNICAKQISYQIEQTHIHHLVNEFLSNSNDVICITNYSGKIQTVTKAFCETFDIVDTEATGICFGKFRETDKIIDDAFIAENTKDPKQNFDITYTVNNKKITIAWNATFVEKEKLIIFSGKDITQKIEIANELTHKNEELENIYNELKSILKNANEAIFKLDTNGIFIEVSDSVKEILGYEPKELVGKSFSSIIHMDDLEEIYKLIITNINNSNIVKKFSHKAKKKNGQWTWLSTSGQTVFNKDNEPQYIIGLSVDISETKEDKFQSKQILDEFINIFNYNPFPVIIYNHNADKVIEINEAACIKYGYSKSDFLQLKKTDFFEEIENNTPTEFKRRKNNTFYNFDNKSISKHIKKDGSFFYANINCREILFKNEVCTICTVREITKELQLNEDLKNSNQRYKLYVENSKDSIYRYETNNPVPLNLPIDILVKRIGEDFYLAETNNVFVKRYGLNSVEELKGLSLKEISEKQKLNIKHTVEEFIKNKYELTNFEFSTIDANGKINYFISSVNGFVENGNLVRIWGTSKNITETKLAQVQLEQSEYRYKFFIENSNNSITRYDFKEPIDLNQDIETLKNLVYSTGYLAECNNVLPNRLGIKKEELYGMNLGKLIHWQKIDVESLFIHFLENNCVVNDFESKLTDPFGKTHYISTSIKGHIENNKLVRIWSTAKDITKEKTEDLQTQFLANILNLIKDAIYTVDEKLKITSWNKGAEHIYGISEKDALGKQIVDFLTPNYSNGGREKVIKEVQQKGNWMGEVHFINPVTRKLTNLLSTITIFENKENNSKQYIVTSKDISEKKLVDSKIIESENRFINIANNAPIMLWQTGANGEKYFYNKKLSEFTGLSQEQLVIVSWMNLVHPDDLQSIYDFVLVQLEKRQPFEIEYRFKHHSGVYKWISDKAVPRFLPNGDFDGYIGICIDIDENKKTFEKIQESEIRFRNMADQAPVMIWLTDENDNTIYYSQGWLNFTGKSLKEELNMPWDEKIVEEDRKKTVADYKKAYEAKKPFVLEYRVKTKKNEARWLLDKGTPRFLSNGQFAGYIGVCVDIQDLKETEFELKEANERYEIINEATSEAIWEFNLFNDKGKWGKGYKKLFGYDETEVDSSFWTTRVHPEDWEYVKKTFVDYNINEIRKNNILKAEYRFLKADKTYAYVREVAYIAFDENGNPHKMIGSKKDISQQKNLESRLIQNEIDKQIAINKAMIEGQEKEKLELSQELHDNINQLISSAKLYMEVAKRNTTQNDMIDKSIETLSEAIQEMRKLSKSLNPITLNKLNLVDAIEQLAYDIEQTGKLTVEFDCSNFNYDITLPQLNLYLYRIVQEQLNNIIKYAKTNEATIKLENNHQFLYLTIADNGIGFDKNEKRNGIGITNIINRVNLFKGDIDIKTSPNNGCSIEIIIPLNIEYF